MARVLPILMYHRVVSAQCPAPEPEEARYGVTLEEFRWQMDQIVSAGCRGTSLRECLGTLRQSRLPERAVVLTFDDGNLSDYVHALPLLKERGFTGTFFVTGNRVGTEGGLEPGMIEDMERQGMEIGTHGQTHRFLPLLDDGEHRRELLEPKTLLEGIIGTPTVVFAPPGGRYDRRTVDVLRELSFEAMCTSRFGFNNAGTSPFELRRFPVTSTTSRHMFRAMILGARRPLLTQYIRAGGLHLMRRLLGEVTYRRLRSKLIGG